MIGIGLSLWAQQFTGAGGGVGGGSPAFDPYMAAATRLAMLNNVVTPSASQLSQITDLLIVTPDYDCYDFVFAFPNWYVLANGTALPETDGPNSITVQASYKIGSTWYPITFSGASSVVIAAGATAFSDPVRSSGAIVTATTRSTTHVRTISTVANTSEKHVGGYRPSAAHGEGVELTAAAQTSKLTNGAAVSGSLSAAYGPVGCFAKGWAVNDGRAVVGIICDSIGVGSADTEDLMSSRGAEGYVRRGLDSASVQRLVGWMLGMNGTSQLNSASSAPGEFRRRAEMFAAACALNTGSAPPITHWLSEHGVNGSGGTTVDFITNMKALYTYTRSLANLPIVQCTLTPRTTDVTGYFFTDLAHQTVAAVFPTADRFEFNAYIRTAPGVLDMGLNGIVDFNPYSADSVEGGKFPVLSYTATLQANVSLGATTFQVDTDPRPYIGTLPVFDPGGSNPNLSATIASVTGSSSPFTITLSVNGTVLDNYLAGTTIKLSTVATGLHPSSYLHRLGATAVDDAKTAGAFGIVGLTNHAPTDMALSANTITTSGVHGDPIGTLSTTDQDVWDSFTYSLTDSVGGMFQISGASLQVGTTPLTAGTKSVGVRTTDLGGNTYDETFSVIVSTPAVGASAPSSVVVTVRTPALF